jgi:hypothetical protein
MADVGTAVVMEELGAYSKRLPEWLITPNTMQKCDFSPENKQDFPEGKADLPWVGRGWRGEECTKFEPFVYDHCNTYGARFLKLATNRHPAVLC